MGQGKEERNIFDLIEDLVRRYPGKVTIVIVAFFFAWFVWPTPYQSIGRGGMMQVNRFTGAHCPVGESCWRERPDVPQSPSRGGRTIDDLLRGR